MVWHLIEQQMNFLRFGIEYGWQDRLSNIFFKTTIWFVNCGLKTGLQKQTSTQNYFGVSTSSQLQHTFLFKADFLSRHYKNKSTCKEVGEEERNSTKVGKQMGVLTFCPKHTLFMNSNFCMCIKQCLIYYYILFFWSEHTVEIWLDIAT